MYWAKTTATRDEKHLKIWDLVWLIDVWWSSEPLKFISSGLTCASRPQASQQPSSGILHCHCRYHGTHIPTPLWKKPQHDDIIKWKHFPRYWPFVWGIHRSPVNSPHKGQWRGALMFSLIHAWINAWVNNREAGDLKHHHAHYDVTVMNHINTLRPLQSCHYFADGMNWIT